MLAVSECFNCALEVAGDDVYLLTYFTYLTCLVSFPIGCVYGTCYRLSCFSILYFSSL